MHGSSYIIYSVIICLYFHMHSLTFVLHSKQYVCPLVVKLTFLTSPNFHFFPPSQVTREFYTTAIYKV